MKKIICYFAASTVLGLIANMTQAATISCKLDPTMFGESGVINLSSLPPISAGIDLPVGTVLYTGFYRAQKALGVYCDNGKILPYTIHYDLKADFNSAPTIVPNMTYQGHTVFQTNVPGIGIAVSVAQNGDANHLILPGIFSRWSKSTSTPPAGSSSGIATTRGSPLDAKFYLVKTGNIGSGTVNANAFPTLKFAFINPVLLDGRAGDIVTPANISTAVSVAFTGQVNITNSTCNVLVPDIEIPLGSHEISKFNGIGSVTDWIKSNINLTGCSNFSNNYYSPISVRPAGKPQPTEGDGSSITGSGNISPGTPSMMNNAFLKLSAVNDVWNASQGVIALSESTNAAKGVGIQVGYGTSPNPLEIGKEIKLPQPTGASVSIPIAARYYQTEEKVYPGIANGKVTYMIEYK